MHINLIEDVNMLKYLGPTMKFNRYSEQEFRILLTTIVASIYNICNFEDDLVDLLEHQYLTTPARHFYLACWFLSLDSLGDQCLLLC